MVLRRGTKVVRLDWGGCGSKSRLEVVLVRSIEITGLDDRIGLACCSKVVWLRRRRFESLLPTWHLEDHCSAAAKGTVPW